MNWLLTWYTQYSRNIRASLAEVSSSTLCHPPIFSQFNMDTKALIGHCFQDSPQKLSVVEVNKNGNGGAFHPFKREDKKSAEAPVAAAASSTEEAGGSSGGCKAEDKEDPRRKARRCWSPELHKRFLQALQQLGGAHGVYQIEIIIKLRNCIIIRLY